MSEMESVGVVGLGTIGAGVARCVAAAGHEVVVFDIDEERSATLGDIASLATSSENVANAVDMVFIAVFDDDQVRDTLTGANGILAASDPPAAILILSTVSMDTVRWASAIGAKRGIAVLDCGVAGGKGLSSSGIVTMVGGSREAFERTRVVLETFSSPLLYMGPLGSGMQAKLGRNMLHYGLALLAFEAGGLVKAAGIDGESFIRAVRAREDVGPGFYDFLEIATASSDDDQPVSLDGMARYATKDLQSVLDLGTELGVDLPTASYILDSFGAHTGRGR